MVEPSLKCNYAKCKATIIGRATATRCGHIFCKDHYLVEEGPSRKCPACESILEGIYDVVTTSTKPSEDISLVNLLGLSPDVIMDIMFKGINFWTFQINQQITHYKRGNDYFRSLLAHKEAALETMDLKIKQYIDQQEKRIEFLKKQKNSYLETITELESQLNEKSRQLINMQMRYEGLRRQSMTSMLAKQAGPAEMEPTEIEPVQMEPARFQQQRIFINREAPPPTPKFVFRPLLPQEQAQRLYTPQEKVQRFNTLQEQAQQFHTPQEQAQRFHTPQDQERFHTPSSIWPKC